MVKREEPYVILGSVLKKKTKKTQVQLREVG
jgi:hypothetical protein